jgi:hypothetical protein
MRLASSSVIGLSIRVAFLWGEHAYIKNKMSKMSVAVTTMDLRHQSGQRRQVEIIWGELKIATRISECV